MTQDKPAALAAAKARITEIDAREAERLRLAGMKRVKRVQNQARGMK